MNKIKSLRIKAGMSQEELAGLSGLSLRTIQRIENGETQPRGHSLRQLCQALGVSMEEVLEEEVVDEAAAEAAGLEPAEPEPELEVNKEFLVLLNLSALAVLLPWPGLGVIAPLILWLLYRNKIEGVWEVGGKVVNFQLTWLLLSWLPFLILITLGLLRVSPPSGTKLFYALMLRQVLDAYNVICIIINAIRVSKWGTARYALAIPFLPA